MKEKADPSAGLVANARPLPLIARSREHQHGASARRRGDNHPALREREGGVFNNHEAEDIAEKGEPVIISGDENRYGRGTLQHGFSLYRLIWSSHWAT